MNIILASTSPYRKNLLQRLQIDFSCMPPDADETPLPEEAPAALAQRLAVSKAQLVADRIQAEMPDALVIGSDQVAAVGQTLLHKPGSHARAVEQLTQCSGQRVDFYTGICVLRTEPAFLETCVVPFAVQFRVLSGRQIESYLLKDQPYDCAGSFKVESLGVALFESLSGTDPTALEGLPLIALTSLLKDAGKDII